MPESPQWKKPSDIMKIRKKKRISIQRVPSNEPFASEVFGSDNGNLPIRVKRRNPFSQTNDENIDQPNKRSRTSLDCDDKDIEELAFFKSLNELNNKTVTDIQGIEVEKTPTPNFLREDEDSCSQFAFIEKIFKAKNTKSPPKIDQQEHVEAKKDNSVSSSFPVDWSLKSKMRVVSTCSLSWCTQLKTLEEATGVTQFVSDKQQEETNEKSEFQSSLMYWIYPSFPWMKMFPRIVPENNIKRPSTDLLADDVQKCLQNEWTESFSSAFHQMRAQQCPYFYVCTHQFTVLFRAKGVAGNPSMCALLTPTTRGLRESLKNEDIEFTMPVLDSKKRRSVDNVIENDDPNDGVPLKTDEEDEDLIDTDEGAHVWLESMGLDRKSFPSLDPHKVKIQREGFKMIDNRPESLAYVEGTNVHGLFNFLLNCRSCIATSGPQAGVPPTILSPTPFRGCTLKSQKVKHSIARQPDSDQNIRQVHILEIAGPVIPHHVQKMSSLLKKTLNSNFSLTFNTHEPTQPFNVPCPTEDQKCQENRRILNMESSLYDSFFNNHSISDRLTSIYELNCEQDGYTWLS